MSSSTLYRLSGISLLVGSILAIVGGILGIFTSDPDSTLAMSASLLQFVGATLGILGLPGMYAKQAQRAGVLGLIGTTLMVCYILILGTFGSALNAVVLPFIATHAPTLAQSKPPGLGLFFTICALNGPGCHCEKSGLPSLRSEAGAISTAVCSRSGQHAPAIRGIQRSLYDCASVPLTPAGPEVRLVIATHVRTSSDLAVGVGRDGVVYELFVSTLPSPAFTASNGFDLLATA